MTVGILGSGDVGRAHAARLYELGYEVLLGSRDPETAKRKPEFASWHTEHNDVKLVSYDQAAAAEAPFVINALNGVGALKALEPIAETLGRKVIIDISNPLDVSGPVPRLFVSNDNSLAEQIQAALPQSTVVKTLNTINSAVQVRPAILAEAEHTMLLCGNSDEGKRVAVELLEKYGWKHIVDLGDLTAARGLEAMLLTWLKLWQKYQTPVFNYLLVKAD